MTGVLVVFALVGLFGFGGAIGGAKRNRAWDAAHPKGERDA